VVCGITQAIRRDELQTKEACFAMYGVREKRFEKNVGVAHLNSATTVV
jgi:hypothetical protein